jgi:hypothetical protein
MDVDVEGEGQSAGLKGLLEEDDQALSLSAFETLEKEFQDVLATLAGDESLDEFRAEYEKVHRALVRSPLAASRLAVPSTRGHLTMPWVVCFSSLSAFRARPFGPRRETAMLHA